MYSDILFCAQQLRQQNSASRGASESIVAEADKLIIILRILTQSSDGNSHTAFQFSLQSGLRKIILGEIVQKLFRRARQVLFLRQPPEIDQAFDQLVPGGLFAEFYEYGSSMTV